MPMHIVLQCEHLWYVQLINALIAGESDVDAAIETDAASWKAISSLCDKVDALLLSGKSELHHR